MSADHILKQIRNLGYSVWMADFPGDQRVLTALDAGKGRKYNVQTQDGDLMAAACELAERIGFEPTDPG